MTDETSRSIIAQVSVKKAIDLQVAQTQAGVEASDLLTLASDIQTVIYDLVQQAAEDQALAAFPGSQVQQLGVPAPAPAPAQPMAAPVPQPVPQPAPAPPMQPVLGIHAGSSDEEFWQDALINNPDNWYDNRFDKRSEAGPDFRHKTLQKGDYKVGLWLNGKAPVPAWVGQTLAQRDAAAAQTAAAPPF